MQDEDTPDDTQLRPSKSERKRASQSLQDLGVALIALPDPVLAELPLPDNLREAVLAARRVTSHGALLRQRQYIGKLMRKVDSQAIQAALERHEAEKRADALRFHRVEQWRDRLIREGERALAELVETCPAADAAELARLAAEARAEAAERRAPRAARVLFQRLRDLLSA
jgi:ribosome-associated protein